MDEQAIKDIVLDSIDAYASGIANLWEQWEGQDEELEPSSAQKIADAVAMKVMLLFKEEMEIINNGL